MSVAGKLSRPKLMATAQQAKQAQQGRWAARWLNRYTKVGGKWGLRALAGG
jgi:hypothetical protein